MTFLSLAAARGAIAPHDHVSALLTLTIEAAQPPGHADDGAAAEAASPHFTELDAAAAAAELWPPLLQQIRGVVARHGEAARGPARQLCAQVLAEEESAGRGAARRARAARALQREL